MALIIISIFAVLIAAMGKGATRRVAQHKHTLLTRSQWLPTWWPTKTLFVGYLLHNLLCLMMVALCLYTFYDLFVVASNPEMCMILAVILVIVWIVGLLLGISMSSKILRSYAKKHGYNLPPECL